MAAILLVTMPLLGADLGDDLQDVHRTGPTFAVPDPGRGHRSPAHIGHRFGPVERCRPRNRCGLGVSVGFGLGFSPGAATLSNYPLPGCHVPEMISSVISSSLLTEKERQHVVDIGERLE